MVQKQTKTPAQKHLHTIDDTPEMNKGSIHSDHKTLGLGGGMTVTPGKRDAGKGKNSGGKQSLAKHGFGSVSSPFAVKHREEKVGSKRNGARLAN